MKTKSTLLSIAIIAALPFAANATQTIVETNTPAAVGANGTVKQAADSGPYQIATIGEHDDEHIATTAYVKGAYNDAIAAVNKVNDSKQDKLRSDYGEIDPEAISTGPFVDVFIDLAGGLSPNVPSWYDTQLVTAGAIAQAMAEYDAGLKGIAIPNAIDSKRVQIYTTWGNDTSAATTLVPFATASQQ